MEKPASRLWVGLLIAFCAVGLIGVVLYVGRHLGPVALLVGVAGALLPVPVLVFSFLWLNRYRPSPPTMLAACFVWGAGIATSGALYLNDTALDRFTWSDGVVASFVAPVVEETLKALLPLLFLLFRRRSYTGIIDGIVFCGLSATGFAMVENIIYIGGAGFAGGVERGGVATGTLQATLTFLLRVPLSGFMHPLFTSMTGIGIGIAARSPRRLVRVVAPLLGLLAAMTLHGSWNGMATLAGRFSALILLYGYFALYMPLFFGMAGFVLWRRSREGRLVERVLPAYAAAGWISPPEIAALATMDRRLSARRWAKQVAGEAGAAAMRRYQAAASSLALLRDGLNRGLFTDLTAPLQEEGRLLHELAVGRQAVAGPWTPAATWANGAYTIVFPDGVPRPVAAPPLPVVPVPYRAF